MFIYFDASVKSRKIFHKISQSESWKNNLKTKWKSTSDLIQAKYNDRIKTAGYNEWSGKTFMMWKSIFPIKNLHCTTRYLNSHMSTSKARSHLLELKHSPEWKRFSLIGNLISETNDESFAFLLQERNCQTLTRFCGKFGSKRGTRQSLVTQTNSGGKEES